MNNNLLYRIIEYDAKIRAIEDCVNALRLSEDLPIMEVMKHIRKLSNKQYKYIFKKEKLIRYTAHMKN